MALAPFIHARSCYNHIFGRPRTGSSHEPLGTSSFSSSSSSSPSCSSSDLNLSWRVFGLGPQGMSNSTQGTFLSSSSFGNVRNEPDHLLVLVHGIMASPSDWTYFEAELKRRLGRNFVIYASSSNAFTKSFTGIDGAGKRLADEVVQVVKKTESLKRISFLAHSLGGLIARYAIAVLYNNSNTLSSTLNGPCNSSKRGVVAGLEPISFITLATPHLGVRGNKQLPFLLGLPFLEKLALPIAPIVVGLTGSQLFLTDAKPDKPPLLLRMASDCEEGKFISALCAFQSCILYANVAYDHMVGWRTSSIRRENEVMQPPRRCLDGYMHVVDADYYPPVPSAGANFPPEAAQRKEAAQESPIAHDTVDYYEIMEEEMIRGLQQVAWKKVDVSFHSSFWPFFAHNNIHVKNEWLYNAGAGVVAHVADTLKQQESFWLAAPTGSS
ncbi:uncharacterized protein LOC111801937 isoform X1 [Cucurbita pepo subsp. pepo]|uniref:uncharacterized protein LOC111801937 isoform X1 n=1 Tax=Cucurbita pepo subsp. pepo TaxID=3664 RepID=UPI000C9D28AA|nr:uncharacterized protein LOC111801937 isoform X1 [Cucurbita pepo subsp. pepo]